MTDIGHPGPTRAGTPFLNIPAFLVAISSTVEPSMRVWSSAVDEKIRQDMAQDMILSVHFA